MIDSKDRRIAVYGLAVEDGAILLARIARSEPAAGMFTLPGGGMEWGEAPRETLEREFREETGLVPVIHHPVLVRSRVWAAGEESDRPVHSMQVVFAVSASGVPRSERSGSTDHAEWVSVERLAEFPVVQLVTDALEGALP